MGKTLLPQSNMAPGIVLGPATEDGFGLYEPGIAPLLGVDIAQAAPPGIVLDKSYDQIQEMAKTDDANRLDYLAAGAGLLGMGHEPPKAEPAPKWKPPSLTPVEVAPPYMQGYYIMPLMEEIMMRNGPVARKLTYNFSR